ncbi:TetR/AcrR family transcriptional regulator [Marinicrinis sediminis]|uniref:TetR/AcrR family transcriptional regulator n=1 Tax=Marinicrinis sediminis TaxID=1652465 RepID=A0ABW5RGV4_9BACL
MLEKKTQIIEEAIALFAEKGYYQTTIQEIAEHCGMSKGSVYSYFESKEDLLLSIFQYYYELFTGRLTRIAEDTSLDSRERIIRQIEAMFEVFESHRDFILMQMKEKPFKNLSEIYEFVSKMRAETFHWYTNAVIDLFGDSILSYAYDCSTILHGMVNEYMGHIILDKTEIDSRRIAVYLVECMEDIAAGLVKRRPQPILNEELVQPMMEHADLAKPTIEQVKQSIDHLKMHLAEAEFDNQMVEEWNSILLVVEEELNQPVPRKVILKGMLGMLKTSTIPHAQEFIAPLERLIEHHLHD